MKNLLRKRLCTCRTTDYGVNEYDDSMEQNPRWERDNFHFIFEFPCIIHFIQYSVGRQVQSFLQNDASI